MLFRLKMPHVHNLSHFRNMVRCRNDAMQQVLHKNNVAKMQHLLHCVIRMVRCTKTTCCKNETLAAVRHVVFSQLLYFCNFGIFGIAGGGERIHGTELNCSAASAENASIGLDWHSYYL
jgi:hypothetical protein